MDLLALLSTFNPRWSTQGNVVMDCPYVENHTHRAGSGKHSLTIWPGIRAFKCYSCGEGGPVMKLLSDKLDYDYYVVTEALNTLPDLAERERRGYELDVILDLRPPKVYLDRGFPPEILRKFRVGTSYYVDKHGKKHKATVIPLYFNGELKGLQYRVETPSGKMVWNTDGFESADFLYNHNPDAKDTMLVEGYADVWRQEMYGFHTEGTLGTTITESKMKLLRHLPYLYVALDNDMPGIRATEKVYHHLKDYTELRFVPYPTKDPDLSTKRQMLLARHTWLDYGGYSYQRIMEYATDDPDDNDYLKVQALERWRYEQREIL
jgi:hypothetical protein